MAERLFGQLRRLGVAAPSVNAPTLPRNRRRACRLSRHNSGRCAAQFQRWFDLTGLQRHLRVLGVFARLHLRDHKSSYLADLPLVTEYVREALASTTNAHSSVAEFRDWFESDLMPVIREQPWYKAFIQKAGLYEGDDSRRGGGSANAAAD